MDAEKQMESIIEEQFAILNGEISKQRRIRQQVYEELEAQLDQDLPRIQDCNTAEAHEREEQDSALVKRAAEECDLICKRIVEEKR